MDLNKYERSKCLFIGGVVRLFICVLIAILSIVLNIQPNASMSLIRHAYADNFGGDGIVGGGPGPGPGPPPGPGPGPSPGPGPGPGPGPNCPNCPPDPDDKDDNNGDSPARECDEDKGVSGNTGNPVNLFAGYESFTRRDILLKGLFDINLIRRYNSQSSYDSPLGYGWSFNYDQRLFEYPDQSVVIRYGCGRKDRFINTGNTYQTPVNGMDGKLESLPAAGEFVYTHRTGVKDFFDTQGRFIARQDALGNRLEFSYDNRGLLPLTGSSLYSVDPMVPMVIARGYRLTKIEERAADGVLTGNFLDFIYDENTGRLSTVNASDGRQITYVHDTTAGKTIGNLLTVNGLEGHVSTYVYDDRGLAQLPTSPIQDIHNITSIQEGAGAIPYTLAYNEDDKVGLQYHGLTQTTFIYEINNQKTVVRTSPDRFQPGTYTETTTIFDPVTEKVASFEDELGNRYEYDYDSFGNLDATRIYLNTNTKASPILQQEKSIEHTYDPDGNKLEEIITLDDVGSGVEVITKTWSYDSGWLASEQAVSSFAPSKIFRTEYTFYRDDGVPTNIKEIKQRKDNGTFQTTTLFYDSRNRLSIEQLPDGHRKHYLYQGVDHPFVTKIYHEIGTTGVESPFDSIRLDYDANGNISDIWDANNNHTQQVYDDRGRLTKTINALLEETIYTYANDRLQQIEIGKTAAEGEGQIIKLNYNANNRLESIQRKNDIGAFITQVSYTYDSEGRKLTEKDGENRITQYEYDPAGNLSKVIDPLLKETLYKYDATNRIVSITDAELNETRSTHDDLGRTIQVEQIVLPQNIITRFTYDAAGNLISVTDGKGQTTQYAYDALSRKTSETKPLLQKIEYFYDDRDRLDYMLNARGQKIDYLYEPWGPVNTVNYYDDDTTTIIDRSINVQYDNPGTVDSITDSSVSASPMYNYNYDALNRHDITTVLAYPGSSITMNDDYDRFGNRNKLTLIDGSGTYVHDYSYNKLNHLATATLPGSQVFNNINYYDNNTLKQLTTPSGIITDYLYEANGPVRDIKFTDNTTSSIIDQYIYTFDNVRNVDTLTESAGLHDYNYDGFYRLTQAVHPAGLGIPVLEDYSYDLAGNREDPGNSLLYDYDANNRILKSPAIASYTYDDDGNRKTTTGGVVHTYNHDNQQSGYTDGIVNASYKYDPAGRRVNKTVDGVTSWYLWDSTNLLAEYNNTGGQLKRYAYLPNQIAPVQMAVGAGIYDIHSDHLQTPKRLTDSNRNTVWQAYYESFGNVNLPVESVEFNLRFPGQYYDGESGLYYNYFRDYDPGIGRYVESDPIGLLGGVNTYAYVGNNPLIEIDPLGLGPTLAGSCLLIDASFTLSNLMISNEKFNYVTESLREQIDHIDNRIKQCDDIEEQQKLTDIRNDLRNDLLQATKDFGAENFSPLETIIAGGAVGAGCIALGKIPGPL